MQVDIHSTDGSLSGAHVLGLKEYPGENVPFFPNWASICSLIMSETVWLMVFERALLDGSCQPERVGSSVLRFRLSFSEYYRCGTTQIRNKLTVSNNSSRVSKPCPSWPPFDKRLTQFHNSLSSSYGDSNLEDRDLNGNKKKWWTPTGRH